MGILDDFKKLFFAQKSVAKSAARKVGDEAKEIAEEGYEKVKHFGEKVADKTEEVFDDAKDFASDIFDDIMKKKETNTNANTSASSSTGSNTTTPTEKKETVLDKAVEMSDKAWEKAEDVGEKVWDKAEDLAGKAKEVAKNVGKKVEEKIDDMLEKAKELDKKIEEERDAIDKNRDGFADKPVNEKLREQGSLLKDKEDFWAKADQYSKGDYSMGKPVVVGKTDPETDDKLELKPVSEIKKKGDDLIDDAEIVDETEPKKE
ncbi:MAG TPA: hypothetical protein VI603_00645 [Saprospiraceae bacterium]|nr:hypothetical protein [Saprospiraceae bacterium]